ncbi:CblZ, a non-orthologous displasment for Alpha-ribazole-5'-phosphate phosphatase [Serinicoccus hydrothermalis]|uniref:CblZ, a non-orthologous displasment for Alpha-ribazole-5'-phosphate phosphatase n=1 Tax=Serinicoccus hydrothermalis TaxID=1758689 RepID=A0A1B1N9Z5_9MICO|nr:DUF3043 domain-containing protein [Serinicoccus hydrothermalis]ANS78234.1 CblZ, a non-orthologous displasment for Alpha-ribazole-5'-phosphate phosphatase [Serinicoccus hydrothermalis]
MKFGKRSSELTEDHLEAAQKQAQEPVDRARPAGKGRPTPKRRDAERANRRPLVVDKKSMNAEQKAKVRTERAKVREAMLRGEEKYLPARDKGPERRFLRDAVDVRWNVGEILLPAMILVLALSLLPFAWARGGTFLFAYALMLGGVIDVWLLWRRTKKRFTAAFGHGPGRGSAWYVVLRAFQMRRSRIPRPTVERGAELHRR